MKRGCNGNKVGLWKGAIFEFEKDINNIETYFYNEATRDL